MFRIDVHEADSKATMLIAGRLDAEFAGEVRRQVLRCKNPHRLVVDLSEATFADNSGEEALSWLGRIGARFIVQDFYWLDVCERLQLPILNQRRSGPRLQSGKVALASPETPSGRGSRQLL